jgi:hypothetical protein
MNQKRSGRNLSWHNRGTILAFACRDWGNLWKPSVRITSVLTKIQTKHLLLLYQPTQSNRRDCKIFQRANTLASKNILQRNINVGQRELWNLKCQCISAIILWSARCRPEGSTEEERIALATNMHAKMGRLFSLRSVLRKCFLRGLFWGYITRSLRPTIVGTGNGTPEVPELPSAWGYS